MVRLNSVNSREIPAAGYNRETQELHLQFKDGTITVYHRVPFQVYQGFIEATLKGRFVKKHLTGLFVETQRAAAPA